MKKKILAAIDSQQDQIFKSHGIPTAIGFNTLKNANNIYKGDQEVSQLLLACVVREETAVSIALGKPAINPQNTQHAQQVAQQMQYVMNLAKTHPERLTQQEKQMVTQMQAAIQLLQQQGGAQNNIAGNPAFTQHFVPTSNTATSAPSSLDMDDMDEPPSNT